MANRCAQEGPSGHTTMNIVVCVKYVPDATADRRFESDNTVDRQGVDGLLSELDEYAVEQALQIKEKADNPD
jgi:electron transfer flavoprotein beta subunit